MSIFTSLEWLSWILEQVIIISSSSLIYASSSILVALPWLNFPTAQMSKESKQQRRMMSHHKSSFSTLLMKKQSRFGLDILEKQQVKQSSGLSWSQKESIREYMLSSQTFETPTMSHIQGSRLETWDIRMDVMELTMVGWCSRITGSRETDC